MKFRFWLLFPIVINLALVLGYSNTYAQGFGIGTNNPASSAILEVQSANKGLLIPRINLSSITDITTITTPDTSLLVYNLNSSGTGSSRVTPGFYYWNGNRWMRIINSTDTLSSMVIDSNPDIDSNSCIPTPVITRTPGVAIPDADVVTGVSDVAVVSGLSGTVCKVVVGIRIDHPFDADLDIYLVGPNGTQIELSTDNGSSSDNYGTGTGPYVYTVFTDDANTAITAGTAPFADTYRPEMPLASYNGINPNGNWTIRAFDDLGGDLGTLISWHITVYTSTAPDWTLIREIPVTAGVASSIIASAAYSCDPLTNGGVKTALTRNNVSSGAPGTTATNLPGTVLFRSASSPVSGTGNYWVSTCMQSEQSNLTPGQVYYFQVWRKGLVEAGNENCSLIVQRQAH